jgi:hypothetical protein
MSVQSEPTEIDSYPAAVEGANQGYYQQGAWKSAQPIAELPGGIVVAPIKSFPENNS